MDQFIYPDYKGKSLLNIPSSILSFFGANPLKDLLPKNYLEKAEGAEVIVLFLIDGLGFNLFQSAKTSLSFFKNLKENGFISNITTVFPSTTAAAINTLYSGLSPLEHGLPEWYVYFPELDAVLESLPFNPVDPADYRKVLNPPKDILFKDKTIFEYLSGVQIPSFSLISQGLIDSLYTKSIYSGSMLIGYKNLEGLTETLVKLITETEGKAFISVYYSPVDTAEHRFGHLSEEVQLEISRFSNALQNRFIRKIKSELSSKVALILTADHGQVTIDPKNTIYLDEITGLVECLKLGRSNKPMPPTSGTRNAFLNVKEDKKDFIIKLLRKELDGKAYVLEMEKAVAEGLFGATVGGKRFLERTGNILLIALKSYALGYHYTPDFELKLLGRHGGLSSDEMLIPFACARLSELKD